MKVLAELVPSDSHEGESVPCLSLFLGASWRTLVFLDFYTHHPDLSAFTLPGPSRRVHFHPKCPILIRTQVMLD